jgi:hypothetical protein
VIQISKANVRLLCDALGYYAFQFPPYASDRVELERQVAAIKTEVKNDDLVMLSKEEYSRLTNVQAIDWSNVHVQRCLCGTQFTFLGATGTCPACGGRYELLTKREK